MTFTTTPSDAPHLPTTYLPTRREYQMVGLQWLVKCYDHGVNAILADEMVRAT